MPRTALEFSLGGVEVRPAHLRGVASALLAGRIRVYRGDAFDMAVYSPDTDTLMVPRSFGSRPGVYRGDENAVHVAESIVVHEAVHASFDLRHQEIEGTLDEAIAYVAQMFFWSVLGGDEPVVGGPAGVARDIVTIQRDAFRIATALRSGTALTSMQLPTLRSHIRALTFPNPDDPSHPLCPYQGPRLPYDGV